MDNESVEACISRCLRGDQLSYAALYDHFAPIVYRMCYSLLLNREDAEDVTQETFVYAFKNIRRYDSARSAFKTWLFTIAICRCRNLYRRSRLALVDIAGLIQHTLHAPHGDMPEVQASQRAAQDAVQQALASLSPRLREAVVLRYGHGLTYREMAEVIGCPPKTAESRVRLAHEALRDLLRAQGRGLLEELVSI
jgi:RNA polymerase sigma-70 factor (ECF subfamily)